MTFIPSHFNPNYKLMFIPLLLALAVTICILLSVKHPIYYPSQTHAEILSRIRTNTLTRDEVTKKNHSHAPKKHRVRNNEVVYNLLSNATRTLIAMEIRARRLEDNIRRVRERTRSLLWKNKDKALWKILFKNISRNVAIRHEFHEHSSLKRIMEDKKRHRERHSNYGSKYDVGSDNFFKTDDYENSTT